MLHSTPSAAGLLPRAILLLLNVLCLSCAHNYPSEMHSGLRLPESWQTLSTSEAVGGDTLAWSEFIRVPQLETLLIDAIGNNPELARRRLEVEIAAANLFQSKMLFWPSLDLRFSADRETSQNQSAAAGIANRFVLSAGLSYELNLWGQLSDQKKAAAFGFSAAQFDYEAAMRELVVNLSSAWLDLLENQQLVTLRSERLSTLETNRSIIESGYRNGLNQALEVYLARNDVEGERSRLLQQQQSLSESQRRIFVLLGQYPQTTLQAQLAFPSSNTLSPPDLPATLLLRRPDIQSAWLRVLQQDASLAVAHKARFPSLTLSASAGKGAADMADIASSNLAWGLGASLIQPLINAGRLKSAEDIARLRLQQFEKSYLDTVYQAFQQVESALQSQVTLESRLNYTQVAANNAVQAEKLAFDQYQRGLVAYSTVLEAQRRSVDAQIQVISLSKQIIVNKISLLNAVGGELDFMAWPLATGLSQAESD